MFFHSYISVFVSTAWGHRIVISASLTGLIQRCPFARMFPQELPNVPSDFLEVEHQDILLALLNE